MSEEPSSTIMEKSVAKAAPFQKRLANNNNAVAVKQCLNSTDTAKKDFSKYPRNGPRTNYSRGLQQAADYFPKQRRSYYQGSDERQFQEVGTLGASADDTALYSDDFLVDAELGSAYRPGPRKGRNLNHLLNFYAEDYHHTRLAHGVDRQRPFRHGHHHATHHDGSSSYNKERFLQANCQFVVAKGGDYHPYLKNPDLLVPWDQIEELRLLGESVPSCPICLSPPVAAKITRCGHIYCWPCILHYLALSDKQWRKCPICYESIYKDHLKSVVAVAFKRYEVGETIALRLMRREKGSGVVLPNLDWSAKHHQLLDVDDTSSHFAKLLTSSTDDVIERIISREKLELLHQLDSEPDEAETYFAREALNYLENREQVYKQNLILASLDASGNAHSPEAESTPPRSSVFARNNKIKSTHYADAFENVEMSPPPLEIDHGATHQAKHISAPEKLAAAENNSSAAVATPKPTVATKPHHSPDEACHDVTAATAAQSNDPASDKFYYFYQAEDGQLIFLHALNARCLVYEYGSLENAPNIIAGRITELEHLCMTLELRQRYRYLSHLPVGTSFILAELYLERSILSYRTIQNFADEFARRKTARQKKANVEKQQQKQAQRWEKAMMLDHASRTRFLTGELKEIPVTKYVKSAQSDIQAAVLQASNSFDRQNSSSNEGSIVTTATDYPQLSSAVCEPAKREMQKIVESPPRSAWASQPSSPDAVDISPSSMSFAQMLRQGRPKASASTPVATAAQNKKASSGGSSVSANEAVALAGLGVVLDEEAMLLAEYQRKSGADHTLGEAIEEAFASLGLAASGAVGQQDESGEGSAKGKGGKKKKRKGQLLFSM